MNFDLFDEPAAPTVEVPPPVQRDLVPCKYCVAWFLPLDYMPWRMDGYCSEAHAMKNGGDDK